MVKFLVDAKADASGLLLKVLLQELHWFRFQNRSHLVKKGPRGTPFRGSFVRYQCNRGATWGSMLVCAWVWPGFGVYVFVFGANGFPLFFDSGSECKVWG